jgi:hypothetical protein
MASKLAKYVCRARCIVPLREERRALAFARAALAIEEGFLDCVPRRFARKQKPRDTPLGMTLRLAARRPRQAGALHMKCPWGRGGWRASSQVCLPGVAVLRPYEKNSWRWRDSFDFVTPHVTRYYFSPTR